MSSIPRSSIPRCSKPLLLGLQHNSIYFPLKHQSFLKHWGRRRGNPVLKWLKNEGRSIICRRCSVTWFSVAEEESKSIGQFILTLNQSISKIRVAVWPAFTETTKTRWPLTDDLWPLTRRPMTHDQMTNVPSKLCACARTYRSWDERTQENLECT